MRIDGSSVAATHSTTSPVEMQAVKRAVGEEKVIVSQEPQFQPQEAHQSQEVPLDKLEKAMDSLNEIFKINNSELRFVLHEGLGTYFAQLVNSETDEIVREIPSKKVLDVFYEMQKLMGLFVDEKI